ncbi:MAG: hypothetical protein FGM14_02845 [Flavobacteriales bacterium]|nr:hypothetical protein [Flavobacteriales bacterium]
MFKDYYSILEVDENVSQNDLKLAFKKQALKWHPDRNSGVDSTIQMQNINEAYLILKDNEARSRYDKEYRRYKEFEKINKRSKESNKNENTSSQNEFQPDDEILKKWMNNAKKQAVDLARETIKEFKGITEVGVKEAVKGAGNQFIYQILAGLLFVIVLGLSKSCS